MTVKSVAFDHVAWINNGPYIPSYIPSYESKNTVEDQVLNQNPNLNSLPSHQCFQSINQVSLIITYTAVKTEIF
ncbi:unnamed protein product [Rhizophagus irregularis]|uniref:Uncharacterized protein n=1 Tax=Rhizophagus irregularis TaxID=588596 RepID=A0A915Z3E6_9GLOM|nr:unnamed protein product [Rhizophagus irregularis]CAB5360216.1 unnamed protein product [Rhizophagus irregularis]